MSKKKKAATVKPDVSMIKPLIAAGLDLIPLHNHDFYDKHRGKKRERGKSPRDFDWRRRKYKTKDILKNAEEGGNTGVRIPASIVVLDVDERNMPEGDDVLSRFVKDLGLKLERYPHVVTGSGGSHYYMGKPEDVAVRDSLEDYPGLEFKSAGRQVVAPGSVHPKTKKLYRFDDTGPGFDDIRPAPKNLLQLIKRPTVSTGSLGGECTSEEVMRMLDALDPEDFRDQDTWLTIMMAAHHASNGDARQEFIEWSTRDPEYADDAWIIGRRWDSLDAKVKNGVTFRTLVKYCIDAGRDDVVPRASVIDDFKGLDTSEDLADREDAPEHERKGPLEKLNDEFIAVRHGGKWRIYTEEQDPTFKPSRSYWTSYHWWDFEKMMANRFVVNGEGKKIPIADVWLKWKDRREAKGIVFDPEGDHPGYLNLWQGLAYEPKQGSWGYLRELIEENLCNGDPVQYNYVLNWCADMLQHPGKPAEVALVFRGLKGTGKGTLGRALAALFGRHALHITSPDHLTGRFNSHLRDVVFLFADEAVSPYDKAAESRLKGLITEPTIPIEGKGKDIVTAKNLIHILMAANEEWVVPMSLEDERRYFCADVNVGRRGDTDFFTKLHRELENGGYEAMLFDLLQRDLGTWRPRHDIPVTRASIDQKIRSLSQFGQFWYNLLYEGYLPFETACGTEWDDIFSVRIFKQDLRIAYEDWCRRMGLRAGAQGRSNELQLMRDIRDLVGPGMKHDVKIKVPADRPDIPIHNDGRAWCYEIPPLEECRAEMERMLGGPAGFPPTREKNLLATRKKRR